MTNEDDFELSKQLKFAIIKNNLISYAKMCGSQINFFELNELYSMYLRRKYERIQEKIKDLEKKYNVTIDLSLNYYENVFLNFSLDNFDNREISSPSRFIEIVINYKNQKYLFQTNEKDIDDYYNNSESKISSPLYCVGKQIINVPNFYNLEHDIIELCVQYKACLDDIETFSYTSLDRNIIKKGIEKNTYNIKTRQINFSFQPFIIGQRKRQDMHSYLFNLDILCKDSIEGNYLSNCLKKTYYFDNKNFSMQYNSDVEFLKGTCKNRYKYFPGGDYIEIYDQNDLYSILSLIRIPITDLPDFLLEQLTPSLLKKEEKVKKKTIICRK